MSKALTGMVPESGAATPVELELAQLIAATPNRIKSP